MKSIKTKPFIASLGITAIEFIVFILWGLNMNSGDEMGFFLISTYFVFPLTALILSAVLSFTSPITVIPFIAVMLVAQLSMPFIITGSSELGLILCLTLIPSAIGAATGSAVKHFKK